MPSIYQIIDQLPANLKKEVSDFALFLLEKKNKSTVKKKKPKFSWEGALKDVYPNMSSVDLQHEILKIRGDIS